MVKAIHTTTLGEAYKQSIQHIIWPDNHRTLTTEDGEQVWRSKDTLIIHVETPNRDLKSLIDYYPMGPQAMKKYVAEVMGIDLRETQNTKDDFTYTYHQRLCQYEVLMNHKFESGEVVRWQTRLHVIDQIHEIINKLLTSRTTRRACAITWRPYEENYTNTRSPPCLQWIKCEIVDNHLNMYTLWRSRDVLLGMGANIYAINALHNYIATSCNAKVGFYEDMSVDAHIYYERDVNYLQKWLV